LSATRSVIVGAGLMGRWHARYAAQLGARIVAVVDSDPNAARSLAIRFPEARSFASLELALREQASEAVHVCTAAASHVELAGIALAAGRHVLLEKPAAVTEKDARRLVESARTAGKQLVPVHQFPFQAGALRLWPKLARLGELVALEFVTCSAGGEGLSPDARRALLLEILPHPLSLFRSALRRGADPGSWRVLDSSADDLAIHASHDRTQLLVRMSLRGRPTRNELLLSGTHGTARLDLFHGYGFLETSGSARTDKLLAPFRHGTRQLGAAGLNLLRRAIDREPAFPGLKELIRRFHTSLRGAAEPPIAPHEIVEAACLIERLASTP
jgi:predicted dehydrogenase